MSATLGGTTGEGPLAMLRLSSGRPPAPPYWQACSGMPALDSTLSSRPGPLAGGPEKPGAQLSVTSRKGALPRQAGLLHPLLTLFVPHPPPPPRGRRLGRGMKGPTLRHWVFLCGEEGPPVAQAPRLRPGLGNFPVRGPGRLFLHPEQRGWRSPGSPGPDALITPLSLS